MAGPTRNTEPAPQMADSLGRWEGEGGAPDGRSLRRRGIDVLSQSERHILECLGAAVVTQWNVLSTDVRRAIFESAAGAPETYDSEGLRTALARFLHAHKDDHASRGEASG